jgi:hypothetical protein
MAWDTTITSLVRYLINDLDSSNYTWTDTQIKKFILISTSLVDAQLAKWTSITGGPYIIDFDNLTITPDPTTASSSAAFITLIAINASSVMLRADYKRLTVQSGWKIIDDRSTIDGTGMLSGAKQSYEDMHKAYLDAIEAFQVGNAPQALAILSPYISPEHLPYGEI